MNAIFQSRQSLFDSHEYIRCCCSSEWVPGWRISECCCYMVIPHHRRHVPLRRILLPIHTLYTGLSTESAWPLRIASCLPQPANLALCAFQPPGPVALLARDILQQRLAFLDSCAPGSTPHRARQARPQSPCASSARRASLRLPAPTWTFRSVFWTIQKEVISHASWA